MLLFFFMVTTVMRETTLIVDVERPESTESVKLENRALVDYIYVGTPTNPDLGSNPRIQLNDAFATTDQIQDFIRLKRESRDENVQNQVITALKVDKEAEMGLITDIKQELRKVDALKICYSTTEAAAEQD